jgi:hypothetical protein
MLLTELKPDYQLALRRELLEGEELLWWGQPDVDAIARSLLPFSIIWLSGLFLMSVSMMLNATGETTHLLVGLVIILILVAVGGVFELVFVPRRAARTLYLLTSKRVINMCVTKKLNASDDEPAEKRVLREDPSSAQGFYLSHLPSQILVFLIGMDVARILTRHFDLFLTGGFVLILLGWVRPWFRDMRYPLAKFREAPRLLYAFDDMFISTETLSREQIRHVKLRRVGKDLFNVFLISDRTGVVRFRALAGKDKAQSLLETFGVHATTEQMSKL